MLALRKSLHAGDFVEVLSEREIRESLDRDGCLDGVPFMPEMVPFCGTVQRVCKHIDKIIDIVRHTGLRRMSSTVTLEGLRCNGSAHGGCQTGCLFLWKEAWLRRVAALSLATPVARGEAGALPSDNEDHQRTYRCQATELFTASSPLSKWDMRQFVAPLWYGNVTATAFLRGTSVEAFNAVQRWRHACEYPDWPGSTLEKTPTVDLGLQPGEWVRVRSKEEILRTLDKRNRNRGMWFDREMLIFCGRSYRVLKRVERLIEESTGRLIRPKTVSIILDGVTARGEYYRFNPQDDYILWREIWLERLQSVPVMEHSYRADSRSHDCVAHPPR